MSSQEDSGREAEPTGFGRFVDKVTDAWFNENHELGEISRLMYAWTGSMTFMIGLFIFEFEDGILKALGFDESLLSYSLLIFFLGIALYFAGLVSYRNTKSGPIRLYLSGFLLPSFVWTIMKSPLV